MNSNNLNYLHDTLKNDAFILDPKEGEKLNIGGMSVTFKITSEMSNNQLGIYTISLPPMAIGAKLHYHRHIDEAFIVTKGVLTIQLGDQEFKAEEGAIAYAKRYTPHGFKNDTNDPVELILLFTPSQNREGFFKGLYEVLNTTEINSEQYLKLYNTYDSYPVDTTNMLPIRQ